jgi:catecholate siderophore receptor
MKKQGSKWNATNLVAMGTLAVSAAAATQGTPAAAEPKEPRGKAEGQAASFTFDIPAGPLASTLEQFRKVTGATTPFHLPPEEIAGFRSKGAKGSLTAEAALAAILDGTGLGYHAERNNTRFEIQIQNAEQVSVTSGTNSVALGQFTEALTDTAQTVNVIPQYILAEQGAVSFKDALKNAPGISLAAGEGGLQGDNLTIRGFSAQKDIFLDGIRDFGSYFRDAFDYESVDVIQGPASVEFGRGSTGGVINQESKQPVSNKFIRPNVQFGTNALMRGTLDTNLPLNKFVPNSALRFNVMGMQSGVAGRDITKVRRVAFAPSLIFGLGKPTRLVLQYMHQIERTTPDYGVTWLDTVVPPVPQNNFYGLRNFNQMNLTPDIATAKLEQDLGSHASLRTSLRYGRYPRQVRVTEAIVNSTGTITGVGAALNPGSTQLIYGSYASTCAQTTSVTTSCYGQNTPLNQVYLRRNNIARNATDDMLWARTELATNFTFHGIGNNAMVLLEGGRERTTTGGWGYFLADGVTAFTSYTSLLNPNPDDPTPPVIKNILPTHVSSQSFGINLMDSMHVTRWLLFSGGIRFDYFNTLSSAPTATTYYPVTTAVPVTNLSHLDKKPTYRAAVVVKPKTNGSVYFDYGTSFNPSAESLSLSANNVTLPPETNETYEVGTKWDLLKNKLNINSSIFRTTKQNAKETDPFNSANIVLAGTQRVQGIQLGALGHLPNHFDLIVGYAYLDNKVVADRASNPINISPFAAVNLAFYTDWQNRLKTNVNATPDARFNTAPYFISSVGLPLVNVAKNTGNFWVTHSLPWRFTGGMGGNFSGPRRSSSTAVNAVYNTTAATDIRNVPLAFRAVPGFYTLNAMLSHPISEHLSAQVNINNLTNKFYIEQPASNRLIPGEKINAQFSLQAHF